jgi:asparaginyl-tRNA synthetase
LEKVVIRQLFRNSSRYEKQEVEISAWVRSNRNQKSFGFLTVNDGTHFSSLQIVYEKETLPNFQEVSKYRAGTAVRVQGLVVMTPQGKQSLEIRAISVILYYYTFISIKP